MLKSIEHPQATEGESYRGGESHWKLQNEINNPILFLYGTPLPSWEGDSPLSTYTCSLPTPFSIVAASLPKVSRHYSLLHRRVSAAGTVPIGRRRASLGAMSERTFLFKITIVK